MLNLRSNALQKQLQHKPRRSRLHESFAAIFGQNVFGEAAMKKHLSPEAYKAVEEAKTGGKNIERAMADQIALGMKTWALSKKVSHYTHWFQPLTGSTAEKHDSFFTLKDGAAIESFNGGNLTQQEPDASSLPNGGIRSTFEARGYTAWDPTSPAFIVDDTLCIPTIFVSYTGEALDHKTPLLKASDALDKAATAVAQYFLPKTQRVTATLGWEQEYFLVDAALFASRPDLVMAGRTVLGHMPARGQQLEDHYFGTIPLRAQYFMKDLEVEALKLGIPITTRHNEVAPNQYEFAPIFEEVNLASDHNTLLIDIMAKVARRHNFCVLFHEKPFAKLNGSGKHNNWSLSTDAGVNLLSPGKTPQKNLSFLTFFVNTIKAVHDYSELIRASISSASNDHRLGAQEAPPAIISVFIGDQLQKVIDALENAQELNSGDDTQTMNILGKIPTILLDNTDRNRTSPFAFTGNKFEVRCVGSSANCSLPMTVLNSIMAKQLIEFKREIDAKNVGENIETTILEILRKYIKASKKIIFNGDGYSQEWVDRAEKIGLPNKQKTPEALEAFLDETNISVFEELNVMSRKEIEARTEIMYETYVKTVQIESRVLGDIARNNIIPTAIKYQNILIENVKNLKEIFDSATFQKHSKAQKSLITSISERISAIIDQVDDMIKTRKHINKETSSQKQSFAYCEKIIPKMESIREHSDKLEMLVADDVWPLTKYREMLFSR